jgi:hypothetical protein
MTNHSQPHSIHNTSRPQKASVPLQLVQQHYITRDLLLIPERWYAKNYRDVTANQYNDPKLVLPST